MLHNFQTVQFNGTAFHQMVAGMKLFQVFIQSVSANSIYIVWFSEMIYCLPYTYIVCPFPCSINLLGYNGDLTWYISVRALIVGGPGSTEQDNVAHMSLSLFRLHCTGGEVSAWDTLLVHFLTAIWGYSDSLTRKWVTIVTDSAHMHHVQFTYLPSTMCFSCSLFTLTFALGSLGIVNRKGMHNSD